MTFKRKSNQGRRGRRGGNGQVQPAPSSASTPPAKASPASDQGDDPSAVAQAPQEGIPPHVWALLQEAGEEAAGRLVDLLRSRKFDSFPPSAQKALIELGLTRAYGLPVRRSVAVNLSSDDADAVASSLATLRDSLPERAPQPRNVTPDDDEPSND